MAEIRKPTSEEIIAELNSINAVLGEVSEQEAQASALPTSEYRQRELGRLEAIQWLIGQARFYRPSLRDLFPNSILIVSEQSPSMVKYYQVIEEGRRVRAEVLAQSYESERDCD